MNATAPTLERIGNAYGLTRQGITDLSKRHGIGRDQLANPDEVFSLLLERGIKSPIRTRLCDPAERLRIATEISI